MTTKAMQIMTLSEITNVHFHLLFSPWTLTTINKSWVINGNYSLFKLIINMKRNLTRWVYLNSGLYSNCVSLYRLDGECQMNTTLNIYLFQWSEICVTSGTLFQNTYMYNTHDIQSYCLCFNHSIYLYPFTYTGSRHIARKGKLCQ